MGAGAAAGLAGGGWGDMLHGNPALPGDSTLSLHRLGCGALDYRELAQQVDLKTGGLAATPHVLPDDSHLDTYEQVAVSSAQGGEGWLLLRLFFFKLHHN